MKKPLVSICCTTFNHEAFVKDTLESFVMQETNFEYEILIHDDASTDNTQEILRAYQKTYPGLFNLILQSENQYSKGAKPFLKYLFPKAQGKYIAMCEGDDYWTDPLKLQKQVDFLEANPEYIVTYHDFFGIHNLETERKKSPLLDSDKTDTTAEDLMLNRKFIKTLTLCFRNVITEFPEEMSYVKNGDTFLISLLGNYGKGKWMGDSIEPGVYRVHDGGVWSLMNSKQRRLNLIITNYWLFQYYSRIGKLEISKAWYNNLVEFVGLAEKEALSLNRSKFELYREQERELMMLKNSLPYKLGRSLTAPLRFVKAKLHNNVKG